MKLIPWESGSYGPTRDVLHPFAPYLSNCLHSPSLWSLAVSLSWKRPWIMQAQDLQVQPNSGTRVELGDVALKNTTAMTVPRTAH